MKITLAVVLTVVLALTFGLVYAEEMSEPALYNGITYFDTGRAPDCASISGVGAGGLAVPEMNNGVTSFELSMTGAKGICAGWTAEAPRTVVHNGITVFE